MKIVLGRDELANTAVSAATTAGVESQRVNIAPVHKASRSFVDEGAIDVCEIAIVTLLQAFAYGKPVLLLPITTLGRTQHQTLVTRSADLTVDDVAGRTVGVRSWSQTTGVWMRGFLAEQYGVELKSINWTTYEDAHLPEYSDPDWVTRAPQGAKLPQDFLDGKVDFAILGNELPDAPGIRTAIPDAADVAAQWAGRQGFIPVNHIIAVTEDAARQHGEAICAIYDSLSVATGRNKADGPGGVPTHPCGYAALRGAFSAAAEYALEQEVLPDAVDYDDLVKRACEVLGVPPARLGG